MVYSHAYDRQVYDMANRLLSEGRFRTVEAWIGAIPTEIVEQNGWLLYWRASCRITARPAEARGMMERAYALFVSGNDPEGSFLSWAGIVNTFMYEWRDFRPLDRWIEEFAKLPLSAASGGFGPPFEVTSSLDLRAHLGHEKIVLLGHSCGAFIAMEYARTFSNRVEGLILCDCAPVMDYPEAIMANARAKGTPDQL